MVRAVMGPLVWRFLPLLAAFYLVLAAPVRAQDTSEPAADLVDALNRTAEAQANEDLLPEERLQEISGIACTVLRELMGDPLNQLLSVAYDNLEAHYTEMLAYIDSPEDFDRLSRDIEEATRAAGLAREGRDRLVSLTREARMPGRSGMVASYSVNLHAGEITSAICDVFRRHERRGTVELDYDRAMVGMAARGLYGLMLVAVANSEFMADPQDRARAGAAAAVGSVMVAQAYGELFAQQ